MSNRSELSQTEPECKYLWKSQPLNQVEGMLIHNYEHDGKCLFVCDPGLSEIRILNLKTGDVLGSIKTQEKPYGIASTSLDGDLMITVFHQVLVLQKNNSGEYFTKNIIEKPHESCCVFSFPYSLVVDSISQQLMVMDSDEGKIHVLSLKDGTELICFNGPSDNAFSDYSFSLSLSGACLNEYSGELFVCDFYSQRVLIFKN
ncbi:hypothetical protein C9374_014437 [Naegleria lovaniensis]|uniref:Uncharacterized protein n=1 Tax=Naegleria lovaniensis TaxID=51637 RepID=A0AA88KU84_NAELO|nr:uncharacterized protein C9374_014437 [Naegleria lovaniensis]KAG2389037.1 hypothetical protein C9374_014437 [Naegleria lovaniensis]